MWEWGQGETWMKVTLKKRWKRRDTCKDARKILKLKWPKLLSAIKESFERLVPLISRQPLTQIETCCLPYYQLFAFGARLSQAFLILEQENSPLLHNYWPNWHKKNRNQALKTQQHIFTSGFRKKSRLYSLTYLKLWESFLFSLQVSSHLSTQLLLLKMDFMPPPTPT